MTDPLKVPYLTFNMALQDKYVHPFTDFGFKKLFGTEMNKDLLIHFLNQVLPEKHRVQDLSYLPTEQLGAVKNDRSAIFDLYCISPSGERFIVEMQKSQQAYFKDRSVFYSTFPIRDQAMKGEWDFNLSPVYLIGVLDFVFNEDIDDPEVRYEVTLKDQNCNTFYNKLTFIYLEMPKFKKTEAELETTFDKWLYVLKHLPDLHSRPAALQERIFQKLFKTAEIAQFDHSELNQYEGSLKKYRDWKSVIDFALTKGIEKGMAQKKTEIARQMKAAGEPIEKISRYTSLTGEEIAAL